MLTKLLNLFKKKQPKNVAYTFEPVKFEQPINIQYDYKLKAIIDKSKRSEMLTLEEVDYVRSVFAPKNKPIRASLYNFIPEISSSMALQMCGFEIIGAPGSDNSKMFIVLQDISHGIQFYARVELRDFDEVFKQYVQPELKPKEEA